MIADLRMIDLDQLTKMICFDNLRKENVAAVVELNKHDFEIDKM